MLDFLWVFMVVAGVWVFCCEVVGMFSELRGAGMITSRAASIIASSIMVLISSAFLYFGLKGLGVL